MTANPAAPSTNIRCPHGKEPCLPCDEMLMRSQRQKNEHIRALEAELAAEKRDSLELARGVIRESERAEKAEAELAEYRRRDNILVPRLNSAEARVRELEKERDG